MKFLKLTDVGATNTGNAIYVNFSCVLGMFKDTKYTILYLADGDEFWVKETPEEIIERLRM